MKMLRYTNLVLDLGGVLFNFTSSFDAPISPFEFKGILDGPIWFAYERGESTQQECYAKIAESHGVSEADVAKTVELAAATLKLNDELVSCVKELKEASGGKLRVFAMSNLSAPDEELLRKTLGGWEIFDDVYTSSKAGKRKPEVAFFHSVIKDAGLNPTTTIYVDDRRDNAVTGQCMGFKTILFDDTANVVRKLKNLCGDPVSRGQAWLSEHAQALWCYGSDGSEIKDQFAQLLILHCTGDESLVQLQPHTRTTRYWNVFPFGPPPAITSRFFPDDLDTGTLAFLALDYDKDVVLSVMDEMLEYANVDGYLYTYFDHTRPRLDPVVCANILRLFYRHNRGHQLPSILRLMKDMLRTHAFLHGSHYYKHPDWILYYLASLCSKHSNPELIEVRSLVSARLQERMGFDRDQALPAALRLVACNTLGLQNPRDQEILLELQQEDGNWDGWLYSFGRTKNYFGSKGVVTAFAVHALAPNWPHCLGRSY